MKKRRVVAPRLAVFASLRQYPDQPVVAQFHLIELTSWDDSGRYHLRFTYVADPRAELQFRIGSLWWITFPDFGTQIAAEVINVDRLFAEGTTGLIEDSVTFADVSQLPGLPRLEP